jgi:hypothetical protein
MKTPQAILVALAVVAALTSLAAAGSQATKQRVAITMHAGAATPVSPFVLTPLHAGRVKSDSGKQTGALPPERVIVRGGQSVSIYEGVTTLKGRRGSLVIRYRDEYVDAGNGYHVGTGTWKVVRGTGQYGRVTGGGRTGNVSLDRGPWSSRQEGVLTFR